MQDNSTMLIEAAKGGHTTVVSVLIDYNPHSLSVAEGGAPAGQPLVSSSSGESSDSNDRFPAEGQAATPTSTSAQTSSTSAVSSLPNKSK